MTPRLSIVVPVYGNWWMTRRLLRALQSLDSAGCAFETIVVDNASPDETPEEMAAFDSVHYARMERNLNFAGGCNAGAKMALAPLVLFLNNDAYPLGDALTPLLRAFEREDVAIAGGSLVFEDGVTQSAGLVLLPNAHWHFACRNLPAALPFVNESRDALAVSGAAMVVRRQWFIDAGGFDERYANGFEDVDLCLRARNAGYAIAYVADARFAHYEGASAGRYDREIENERRFYAAWSSQLGALPRMQRGSVGAIVVRTPTATSPLEAAALHDLSAALASFGHPVLRKPPTTLQRVDERMRRSAELAWLTESTERAPKVTLERSGDSTATLRADGAVDLDVPWLACADPTRVAQLPLTDCDSEASPTIAVAGYASLSPERQRDVTAALDAWLRQDAESRLLMLAATPDEAALASRYGERARTVDLLRPNSAPVAVTCVLQLGLTDAAAFGNVLLAQAPLATLVVEGEAASKLLASDVVVSVRPAQIGHHVAGWRKDAADRQRYARWGAADARRRFSPRRSAIRVIDLLCAARFGLERAGAARSDTPLRA